MHRERLSWLDEKFSNWLDRNGPFGSREDYGFRQKGGKALLMLAATVACLASFIPAEKPQRSLRAEAAPKASPELISHKVVAVLGR